MRSIAMKFAAVLLAALMLLTAVAAAGAMYVCAILEINDQSVTEVWSECLESYAYGAAYSETSNYATATFGDLPEGADRSVTLSSISGQLPSGVTVQSYTIFQNGVAIASGGTEADAGATLLQYIFTVTPYYYVAVYAGQTPPANARQFEIREIDSTLYMVYECHDREFQTQVTLCVAESESILSLLHVVVACHGALPFILLGSLLIFAACLVYLCWAAGRSPKSQQLRPRALNALPLDLYAVAVAAAGFLCVYLLSLLIDLLLYSTFHAYLAVLSALPALALCLLIVGFVFALAAQVKAENHFWWRHSVTGFVCIRLWRVAKRLLRAARSFLRMIPTIWQWLLTAGLMVFVPLVLVLLAIDRHSYYILPCFGALLLDAAIIAYAGWCFGQVLRGAERMAHGDLDTKIDTRYLVGSFRDCAVQLNSLSCAALVAAREKMRSERMKTELITNVSHDIKTPLTSIINYVDLLQAPHSEADGAQYLEVLSRQSARLKKLIEDLMEMSKASSGNITAQLVRLDAVETVYQALGEFSDKLTAQELTPIFRQPEAAVYMRADGRLAWRVMSNLLSNAVKYSMPGTRLYVDIAQLDGSVLISFKNVSREPLNISAEELMERFVRADTSRNTEGSGLGLNIAESLMEVQGGSMRVLVDGDLFKVTLCFPADA